MGFFAQVVNFSGEIEGGHLNESLCFVWKHISLLLHPHFCVIYNLVFFVAVGKPFCYHQYSLASSFRHRSGFLLFQ